MEEIYKNIDKVVAKERIDFISWLQFVGVLSVIFGHSMNDVDVSGFFKELKAWIYTFHMPLFFFVSAYLFSFYGGYERGYKEIIYKRFTRLLVPYFIWNLFFIVPKIIMAPYINDKVELTPEYFISINLFPRNNILGHTWFLFALFEMFLFAVFLDKIRRNQNLWLPVASMMIVIYCFGFTERLLCVGDLMKNGIFFWLGLILGSCEINKILLVFEDRQFGVFVFFNVIIMSLIWYFCRSMHVTSLMLCTSILTMLMIIQHRFNIKSRFIEFVSLNCFAIYVLHWPFMGLVRFLVKNKLHLEPNVCMYAMLLGGVFFPCITVLIMKKFQLPVLGLVKKYMLGMCED